MTPFYDARGNIYGVMTPDALRAQGLELPATAAAAVQARDGWALAAIEACCAWAPGARLPGSKAHRCDGLLVGPFLHVPTTTFTGSWPTTLRMMRTSGSNRPTSIIRPK